MRILHGSSFSIARIQDCLVRFINETLRNMHKYSVFQKYVMFKAVYINCCTKCLWYSHTDFLKLPYLNHMRNKTNYFTCGIQWKKVVVLHSGQSRVFDAQLMLTLHK